MGYVGLKEIEATKYHADRKSISASAVELYIEDPRLFEDWQQGKAGRLPGNEMILGDYVHTLVAGEDLDRFIVPPRRKELDPGLEGTADGEKLVHRGTKEGKRAWAQFLALAEGRTILLPEHADIAPLMLEALALHPEAWKLLTQDKGLREQSAYWKETAHGVPMRCRFDIIIPELSLIVELKTDQDINRESPRNPWRWYRWGYHRKAAIYLDAAWALYKRNFSFRYVMVENNAKPRVVVRRIEVDSPAAEIGRREYRAALQGIAACRESGDWRLDQEKGFDSYPLPPAILHEAEFAYDGELEGVEGAA